MEISGIGIQQSQLSRGRPDDVRMAMPDMRHIVGGIEVCASEVIVDIRAATRHKLERIFIRHAQIGA